MKLVRLYSQMLLKQGLLIFTSYTTAASTETPSVKHILTVDSLSDFPKP